MQPIMRISVRESGGRAARTESARPQSPATQQPVTPTLLPAVNSTNPENNSTQPAERVATPEAAAVAATADGPQTAPPLLGLRQSPSKSLRGFMSMFGSAKPSHDADGSMKVEDAGATPTPGSLDSSANNVSTVSRSKVHPEDPGHSNASHSSDPHVTHVNVSSHAHGHRTSHSPVHGQTSDATHGHHHGHGHGHPHIAVRRPSVDPRIAGGHASRRPSHASATPGRRRSSASSIAETVSNFTQHITKMFENLQNEVMDERKKQRVAELVDKEVLVLNADQLAHIQKKNTHPFTISINSNFRHWWDFVLTISVAYVLFVTPVKLSFDDITSMDRGGVGYVIDVMIDLIYLIEITLNFFTSYIDDATGEEVKTLNMIRHNYIYGWFIVDALNSFPSSLIGTSNVPLQLMKLLKVARVIKLSDSGLFKMITQRINRTMNPSLMRMSELTLIFFISQHFIACAYYFTSRQQNEDTGWGPNRTGNLYESYVDSMYFAIMVTTANDVSPHTSTEKLFTSVMLVVGIIINASIIGSAANLLANMDKAEIARKNQMDSINDYLRFKKVPLSLQNQIRRYYEYALTTRMVDPTHTLFADLPDRLKLSLKINLHDEFIRKVPLFKVCSSTGVIAMMQCLNMVVVMAGEIIINQGEVGHEFYFIKCGRVALFVRTDIEEIPLGTLGEGSFFGEQSLLTGEPQKAEVKAESITELAYLTKEDFTAIIDKFPTFFLAVKRISDSRMQTAQNVQKMKLGRDKRNSTGRRLSLKTAAQMLSSRRVADKMDSMSIPLPKKSSESRSTFVSVATGPALRLTKRMPSSRRKPTTTFNVKYLEKLSLAQARHLATMKAIEEMEIDANDEWDNDSSGI